MERPPIRMASPQHELPIAPTALETAYDVLGVLPPQPSSTDLDSFNLAVLTRNALLWAVQCACYRSETSFRDVVLCYVDETTKLSDCFSRVTVSTRHLLCIMLVLGEWSLLACSRTSKNISSVLFTCGSAPSTILNDLASQVLIELQRSSSWKKNRISPLSTCKESQLRDDTGGLWVYLRICSLLKVPLFQSVDLALLRSELRGTIASVAKHPRTTFGKRTTSVKDGKFYVSTSYHMNTTSSSWMDNDPMLHQASILGANERGTAFRFVEKGPSAAVQVLSSEEELADLVLQVGLSLYSTCRNLLDEVNILGNAIPDLKFYHTTCNSLEERIPFLVDAWGISPPPVCKPVRKTLFLWIGLIFEAFSQFRALKLNLAPRSEKKWQDFQTFLTSMDSLAGLLHTISNAFERRRYDAHTSRFLCDEQVYLYPLSQLVYMPNFSFRRCVETECGEWRHVKLFLVGDSGVGKTSLFRFLRGLAFESNSIPTQLAHLLTVDVRQWKKLDRPSEHLWDMLVDSTPGRFSSTRPSVPPPSPSHLVPTVRKLWKNTDKLPQVLDFKKRWHCPERERVLTPTCLKQIEEALDRKTSNPLPLAFAVWDFAGEEVYYSIHHFLLTSAAVYVLVVNMADIKTERISFWLQSIRFQARDAPIFIILTHLDLVQADDQSKAMEKVDSCIKLGTRLLAQRDDMTYEQFVAAEKQQVFAISCAKSGEDQRDKVRNALTRIAEEQVKSQSGRPLSWMFFFDKLKTDERLPHDDEIDPKSHQNVLGKIDLDAALAVGVACGIANIEALEALKFFHDFGFIFWCHTNANLRSFIFMLPQRLVNVLKIVIQDTKNLGKRFSDEENKQLLTEGKITDKCWSRLCSDYRTHSEVPIALRELLLEFNVAIRVSDGIVIPSLIDNEVGQMTQRTLTSAIGSNPLECIYTLQPMFPIGLTSILVVNAYRLAERGNTDYIWTSGCGFRLEGLWVGVFVSTNTVEIRVQLADAAIRRSGNVLERAIGMVEEFVATHRIENTCIRRYCFRCRQELQNQKRLACPLHDNFVQPLPSTLHREGPTQHLTRGSSLQLNDLELDVLNYSDPLTIDHKELFHTKETVDKAYIDSLIAIKHLFGPQSLSSYLRRKLNNESLPEFDLTTELQRDATIIVAGILPGDIDAFGTVNKLAKQQLGDSGDRSAQSGANSWKPSWFKFFSNTERKTYYVLAVWPGKDVVTHYALTVCCRYPSLAERVRVWRFPIAEDQVFVYTKLEETTKILVNGAVVVLGESDGIKKWLSEHFELVGETAAPSKWYQLTCFTNKHAQRIVLLQVVHPYWGSIAGSLASRLFSYGCMELVHCGNVGRLLPTEESSLTNISAPRTARHVASLQSVKIKNPLRKWLHSNPPSIKLFPDHVHISISSPVLETKMMIEEWPACSTIDVEVFSLAKAAAEENRPFSCLHYISDVVGSTHSLGNKWEDSLLSGAQQARDAMIISVSTYLSQYKGK